MSTSVEHPGTTPGGTGVRPAMAAARQPTGAGRVGVVGPVFAVLLLALAGCTALAVRRRGASISEEALGFAVIGAAGLALLAVAVLVVGRLSGVPGRAEGLALLGLGGFVVYLLAAWVVLRWLAARTTR